MIWGVGYGALTVRPRNYSRIITNGVPNIADYGNLTPTNYWLTNTYDGKPVFSVYGGRTVQFENPCSEEFDALVISVEYGFALNLGSAAGKSDLGSFILTPEAEHTISLENITTPFYISFRDRNASSIETHYPLIYNAYMTTL